MARGRKRLRSEVSRASEGTKRSKSGERRRHSGRQNEHRSSGKRVEIGGDVIGRHRNKVIMIRKGRHWEADYGVAEWIHTELGELDIQITKTNDRCTRFGARGKERGRGFGRQRRSGKRKG